jgi:hypothetical protein
MSRATKPKKPRKLTKRQADKLRAKLFASLTDGSIIWPMSSGLPNGRVEHVFPPHRISRSGRA